MSARPPRKGSLLVCYQGAPAALVSLTQTSFVGDVRHLPPGDPTVRMVVYMAYYAELVLAGEIPDRYADDDAERFARLALIDPPGLARHGDENDEVLAAHYRVPLEEINHARRELRSRDAS
jgi:hypothetical protein